jgi:hypothetical protein
MKAKHLVVLLCAVVLFCFAGCKTVPANQANNDTVVGTWKDSYGLTEYKFKQDGKMQIEALNIGSFNGSYEINNDKITIEYSVVVNKVKDTYSLKLNGNTMYLDDKEFTRKK